MSSYLNHNGQERPSRQYDCLFCKSQWSIDKENEQLHEKYCTKCDLFPKSLHCVVILTIQEKGPFVVVEVLTVRPTCVYIPSSNEFNEVDKRMDELLDDTLQAMPLIKVEL